MVDIADFKALQEKQQAKKIKELRPELVQMAKAEVDMEYVVTNEHWNSYLEYLQGMVNQKEEYRVGLEHKLSDPKLVNPDEIALVRMQLVQTDTYIGALNDAMAVPKQLMDAGFSAKKFLKRLRS